MQKYPSGDYTQGYYTGVDDEDYSIMDGDDDYHYNHNNNSTFSHQNMGKTLEKGAPHAKQNYMWDNNNFGKDEYQYRNGSMMKLNHDEDDYHYNNNHNSNNTFPHHNMQKMHDKGAPHAKQNNMWDKNNFGKDEYHFKNGSTMQMKPNHQWVPPQKHGGYGGYEHNTYDNFKHGHEDYNAQSSESWYEQEEEYNTWNNQIDYFGLGKHQNAKKYSGMSHGVEKSGGYGAHQGPHMPMAKQRPYQYQEAMARPMWCAKGVKD